MISDADMTQIINRVRSEFGASPMAWLTNQWQPFLGAGRASNAVVPYCNLADRAGSSAANVTWTSLSYEVVVKDTANFYNAATPTRIFLNNPGRYLVCQYHVHAVSAVGLRYMRCLANGTTEINETRNVTLAATGGEATYTRQAFILEVVQNGTGADVVNTGGYIELQALQTTGGALGLFGSAQVARIGNV